MNLLELWLGRAADRESIALGPRPTVIGPAPPITVAPSPRFAWDEKHWRRIQDGQATHYVGQYRVGQPAGGWREFGGRLVEGPSGIKAYVADPPPEIRSHPKGPCFQLVRAPWFQVHWRRTPATVDEALLYVERLLTECLNGRSRAWW